MCVCATLACIVHMTSYDVIMIPEESLRYVQKIILHYQAIKGNRRTLGEEGYYCICFDALTLCIAETWLNMVNAQ